MEIPITIVTENKPEIAQNLLGVAGKVDDPEIRERFGENAVWINKRATISEGIELHYPTNNSNKETEGSMESDKWFEWNLSLVISEDIVSLAQCGHTIAEWLWDHLERTQFEIQFNGKRFEENDKSFFQESLDEYVASMNAS